MSLNAYSAYTKICSLKGREKKGKRKRGQIYFSQRLRHTDPPVSVQEEHAMSRKARIVIPGVAHHVIQRGRNRQVVFAIEEDFQCYLENLVGLKSNITNLTKSDPYFFFALFLWVALIQTS